MRWRGRRPPVSARIARFALPGLARRALYAALVTALLPTASVARVGAYALVPTLASASIVASDDSLTAACRSLECVRQRMHATITLRLDGEFGRFTGHVTRWDADSLAGFEADPDWGGSVPVAAVGWSQISRVEQRKSNSGRGAIIGAVTLGAITALFVATAASLSSFSFFGPSPAANRQVNQAAWNGALIGGALGAGIGAGIGSGSHRWILVYRRR